MAERVNLIFRSIVLISLSLLLVHCAGYRTLSESEKKTHNLSGELANAEICPTAFDEKLKIHVKTGPCEWVRCEESAGSINCRAKNRPFEEK